MHIPYSKSTYDMYAIVPTINTFIRDNGLSAEMKEGVLSVHLSWLIKWDNTAGIHCLIKIAPDYQYYGGDAIHWKFWCGAWKDLENGMHAKIIVLKEKAKAKDMINDIGTLLSEGYSILSSLHIEELEFSPELSKNNQEDFVP